MSDPTKIPTDSIRITPVDTDVTQIRPNNDEIAVLPPIPGLKLEINLSQKTADAVQVTKVFVAAADGSVVKYK